MSRNRRRKSRRVTAAIEAMAACFYKGHLTALNDDYVLQKSSRVWQRNNGDLTLRLVYRHRRPKEVVCQSRVITLCINGGCCG